MTDQVNSKHEAVELLAQLVAIYKTALESAERKQAVLSTGTIEELKTLLAAEEKMAASVSKLERQRITLQERHGWPPSISQLAAALPEQCRREATLLADELTRTVKALAIQNSVNSEIIHHLQNYTRQNLDLIHQISPSPAYGYGGEVPPAAPAGRSIVDRKI